MDKPKILIVEDNKTLADAIGATCEMEPMKAVVVYNGMDALAAIEKHHDISCIILDIKLPDISGFDVCRRIREKSKVPILFMTSKKALPDEISGLEMGADGYLKKPVSPKAVVAHIRATVRRVNEWSKEEILSDGEHGKKEISHPDFIIDNDTKVITYLGQPLDLTPEEYAILSHMIKHPGRIFSKEQIINIVGEDIFILPSSVRTKIMRIRQKLQKINPSCNILVTVHGMGYKLVQ